MKFIESLINEGLISSDTLSKVDGSMPQNTMVGNRPASTGVPPGATQATQMQNVSTGSTPGMSSPAPSPADVPQPEGEPPEGESPEETPEDEKPEDEKPEESFSPSDASLKLAEHFLGEMEKDIKEDEDERGVAIKEARQKLRFILGKLDDTDPQEPPQDPANPAIQPPLVEPEEEMADLPAGSRFLEWATESKKDSTFKVDRLAGLFDKVPRDRVEKVVAEVESNKIVKRDAILEMMRKIFTDKE